MIRLVNRLVVVVLVGAIASGVALAKEIKKKVTFSQPVVVNGTPVKKGTYDAVFDDQTSELSIVKDGKVVARAPAQLEKRVQRDRAVYVTRTEEGDSTKSVLISVTLKDGNQATIVMATRTQPAYNKRSSPQPKDTGFGAKVISGEWPCDSRRVRSAGPLTFSRSRYLIRG